MDLNKVQIIGRLTRDPEIRTTSGGQSVANLSVATGRQWTDKQSGEKKEQTEFHNVVAWARLADICQQYLHKGVQVYVEGRLQTRSWDDQSGAKKYRTEIVAENIILLGGRQEVGGNAMKPVQQAPQPAQEQIQANISVDDIPFN